MSDERAEETAVPSPIRILVGFFWRSILGPWRACPVNTEQAEGAASLAIRILVGFFWRSILGPWRACPVNTEQAEGAAS